MTVAEEWRSIDGFPGYEASSEGRIRSFRMYRGDPGPRVLTLTVKQPDGSTEVHLSPAGLPSRVVRVHSLVMLAFVGPRPEGLEVRHLDGDPINNRLANLRYGTHLENMNDQREHGTNAFSRRTHCKYEHEYTPENTVIYTSSVSGRPFRQCITCNRAKRRRQRKQQQLARAAA